MKSINQPNERRRSYIEAFDNHGNTARKTAKGWADYQAMHGNPKGNSPSAIARRYANKAENGYTNQQCVDYSLIEKKVGRRGKALPKKKNVDSGGLLSRFNRSRLAG